MYIESTIKKYLEDLSSNLPAPGGGSASALVSSAGISLFLMVCNFTIGKEKYKEQEAEIKKIKKHLEEKNSRLQELIDEDVRAYGAYSRAVKLPKETEGEKTERNKAVEAALVRAAGVPLEIMEISVSALEFAAALKEKGNKNLITDVCCGENFLSAGLKSAGINVEVNLPYIKNEIFRMKVKEKMAGLFLRLSCKGLEMGNSFC